ncbi:MAG TPA: alpha/beta hydrolase [Chryseosolibacter sp.]
MKKRWKFLIFLAFVAIVTTISLVYFLLSNDAPIVVGDVDRNIEYKTGLRLDIYQPTRDVYDKAPVIVYIHGGAWIGGFKESINFNRFNQAAFTLRESGYAIVSVNYTLAHPDKSPFPDCIKDALDAVAWLNQHAQQYNFDIENIGLLGESAGAHIAMMAAYSQDSLRFNYVVDIYGPTQLAGVLHTPMLDTLNTFVGKFSEGYQSRLSPEKYIFGLDPKRDSAVVLQIAERYSPYNYLSASVPPTLIIHGDLDRVVPVSQSTRLQRKLDSLGVINDIHIVQGADHNFIKASAAQKAELQKRIVSFISSHYNRNKVLSQR